MSVQDIETVRPELRSQRQADGSEQNLMPKHDQPSLAASMRRHASELCSECQTFSPDGSCLHGPVCVADRLLDIAETCEQPEPEAVPALQMTRF